MREYATAADVAGNQLCALTTSINLAVSTLRTMPVEDRSSIRRELDRLVEAADILRGEIGRPQELRVSSRAIAACSN